MSITTNTKIFGSFSEKPGNNGARFFNTKFSEHEYDAIYLPIKCSSTEIAVSIIKEVNFTGAAFSMPHKIDILKFLDYTSNDAQSIGAVNTVLYRNGQLEGYNTDWIGIYKILQPLNLKEICIFGNGGYSRAVQYACKKLNISYSILSRNENIPHDRYVFNATPISIQHPHLIDGRTNTHTGQLIYEYQAIEQFTLYKGLLDNV